VLVGYGVVRWWFGSWVVGGLIGDGDARWGFGLRVVSGDLVGDDGDTIARLVVLLLWFGGSTVALVVGTKGCGHGRVMAIFFIFTISTPPLLSAHLLNKKETHNKETVS